MKKVKTLIAIILTLAVVFAVVACNNGGTTTSQPPSSSASGDSSPAAGGDSTPAGSGEAEKPWVSFTIGNSAWLGIFLAGLNPSDSMTACSAVFDTILYVDRTTREPTSRVLKDWGFKDDLTYYMEIRDDVYFSNGDHATAEDVYFSYWNHPERGSNWLQNHGIIWEESGPVSEYRVEFKLEKHYPAFPERGIYLVDKKWSEEVGWDSMEWYNPVGSGPFYVYEYVNDSHIILRTRESIGQTWWYKDIAGPIYVDEWIVKYYPDPSALFMALQTGEVDYADISSNDYGRWVDQGEDPNYTCVLNMAGSVDFFMFGFEDSDLWFNKNLREAVAYGINWQQIGQVAAGNAFIPARSIASQVSADFVDLGIREFDLDRAKALMEGEGYGPSNHLSLYTVTMTGDFYRNAFEAIQYFMKDFYIDLEVDFADNAGAIAAWLAPGNTDCGIWMHVGGSTTGDLGWTLNEIRPNRGLTWSGIHDDAVIALYDIMTGSDDEAAQHQAAIDIQHMIYDNYYYIPFAEWTVSYGWRNSSFSEEQVTQFRGGSNMVNIGAWSYLNEGMWG